MPSEKRMLSITAVLITLLLAEFMGLFVYPNTRLYALTPYLSSIWMRLITDSASFAAFVIYILMFALYDIKKTGKVERWTLRFVLSLFAGMVVVGVLKVLLGVPRPGEPFLRRALLKADYFAFPSGHATRASILAYSLGKRFPKYRPLWWAYAILVALSRLFLHVHWFSDVLFGLLLGPWVLMLVEATEDLWLPVYNSIMQKLKLGVLRIE
ncbi:phosphatase PAP2 family protein [Thermococcus atlanticus]